MRKKFTLLGLVLLMVFSCITVRADMGIYSWEGEWETNWGKMVLTQDGATVTGTYTHDNGKIIGTASGNKLIGTWSEAPSYAPDADAGDVELEMSSDGKSFTGKWRYGSTGGWGTWDGGKRITDVILAPVQSSFYEAASKWAEPELEKAGQYGLIPDSLKGEDMTKPITREEFAELSVKLYEKTTGKSALAISPNPFTDTTNPEILKAFKLGITTGTSATTFTPKELTNREQVATMLSRAIRVMAPNGDFSTVDAPTFSDQKDISSWALEHVKYMSKLGIIKGSDGKFMPKATTTVQQASGYATTTREQAVVMSVRTFEQFDTIKASSTKDNGTVAPTPTPTPAPTPTPLTQSGTADESIVGTWFTGYSSGSLYTVAGGYFGASGAGTIYTFNADGTYVETLRYQSAYSQYGFYLTGKYSVKDGVIALTNRVVKDTTDDGKNWSNERSMPDTSEYYSIRTDEYGKYMLIGLEGVKPPLDDTNAAKYSFYE